MALSTNLVSYYKLDSNSNDSVGSNNGTNSNVTYSAGKLGNSAVYSGSDTSYTDLGSSFVPTTALSVSFWFKTSIPSVQQAITGRTDGLSASTSVELFQISNSGANKVEAQINIGSSSYVVYSASSPSIVANKWYHVALTWSSATGNLSLYLNSVRIAQVTGVTGTLNNPSSLITRRIAQYGTYIGLPLSGSVDELAYWSREITADEVSQVFNSGRGNQYPLTDTPLLYGAVAYYKLDESSGNAVDSIGVFTLTNTGSVTYETGKISNSARNNNSAKKLETTQSNIGLSDTGNASFSMWIRFNSWSVGTSSVAYCLDWFPKSGSVKRAIVYTQATSGQFKFYASANQLTVTGLSLGVFYNVVGVKTGSTWEIFVDNVSKGTVSVGTANFSGADTLTILNTGQNPDLNQARSDINIDELGIFTRALNSTERSSIFLGGSGNQYPFSGTLLSQNSSFLQFM